MLKYVTGDIISNIDPKVPTVIIHGCNCQNIMGKGLAAYLRKCYPGIYEADCKTTRGDRSKLGTYSVYKHTDNLIFLNCYIQYSIYRDQFGNPPVDYDAMMRCLVRIAEEYQTYKIRTPLIGCGLAGGLWRIVENMFMKLSDMSGLDITVYMKGNHSTD